MKKEIILITLFALGLFVIASATTIEVCATCTTKTIKAAIEKSVNGDLILIKSGIYKEGNILIKKSIHLKGEGYPIIDGENQTEIITVNANDVTIEGLQIQNVGNSYIEDRAGIRVEKGHRYSIKNNKLINTFFGIYLAHAHDGEVLNNIVIGEAEKEMSSGNAIHLWYCKRVKVEDNKVKGHRDGIYFEFVDDSKIRNNTSEENLRYGLHFMCSNDDDYSNNIFRTNGAGVAVMFSRRINMWENVFEQNWGEASYGLLLKEIYDAEITNNLFKANTTGIFVEGSNRVNYTNNDFESNGWAIKVSGGCMDNSISGNNFIANTFDLSMNSSRMENLIDGNYWSEYSGYDLDKDGVGDVPHRPIKLFNYVLKDTPEAVVLLRSIFVDLINFSEKVSPVFTPDNIKDEHPVMRRIVRINSKTK